MKPSLGEQRARWLTTPRAIVVAVVMVALGMQAGVVLAGHQFSDVGTNHPFHGEISAMADAGITTGFPDGTFRPANNVTRQAMAAFLGRGLSRAAWNADFGQIGEFPVVVPVVVEAGASGDGVGFVLFQGSWSAISEDTAGLSATCPCEIEGRLVINGEAWSASWDDLAAEVTNTGWSNAAGSVTALYPVAADDSVEAWLVVDSMDWETVQIIADAHLTAIYVPFGPTGTADLFPFQDTVSGQSVGPSLSREPFVRQE